MPRLLIALLCSTLLASPAFAGAQETLTQWQYVQDPDSGATFDEINQFLIMHPRWPDQKRIRVRAERMMRGTNLPDDLIIGWFTQNPPVSGVGKWTYAEALRRGNGNETEVERLVHEAWRDADLTEDEEQKFLSTFGGKITTADHIARVDRLLWEGKPTAAKRIIPKLPVAHQVLAQARIALQQDAKNANFLVSEITGELKENDGLQFDRMQYRMRKKDKDGVRDILMHTPKEVAYPERWWKIREMEVRRAIDEKNYHTASKLLANHGQSEGSAFADALWLDGWIKLEFLDQPGEAYKAFYHMFDVVKTPVSKARAAYWLGRAAKKSGDSSAQEWFSTAARYPTAFYGQLAASELSSAPSLSLPDQPSLSFFASDPALPDDMEEAIRICIRNGDTKLATRLINSVIENAESEHSVLNVAALGHELAAPHISVKAAKKAQQKGVVLKEVGYPRPDTAKDLPVERPLTLAIARQESEFDPFAESPAGALGMMQLLPGTAKETAKKIDMPYAKGDLTSPDYNMRLGSHYLARMVNSYSGSYVMAIASYNAGPGNVRKWTQQFGTPGSDPYTAVNWIEMIPFSETRNYVMRVMENLQVYRALEGENKLAIREDLVR